MWTQTGCETATTECRDGVTFLQDANEDGHDIYQDITVTLGMVYTVSFKAYMTDECADFCFKANIDNVVTPCDSTCLTCSDLSDQRCLACPASGTNLPLAITNVDLPYLRCVASYPANSFVDIRTGEQKSCENNCRTCHGHSSRCTSCYQGQTLSGGTCS